MCIRDSDSGGQIQGRTALDTVPVVSAASAKRWIETNIGLIVDVPGDGNCGYHAIKAGLNDMGISSEHSISMFRRGVRRFAETEDMRKIFRTYPQAFNRTGCRDVWWQTLLNTIFDPKVVFDQGCSMSYWLDSANVMPIISAKFKVTIVVFDVADKTPITSLFRYLSLIHI